MAGTPEAEDWEKARVLGWKKNNQFQG